MLPFEFIVVGTPLSYQTKDRTKLRAWMVMVREAAQLRWPLDLAPHTAQLRIIVVYYNDAAAIRMDNDNMVKPIQDALNGLVYVDDKQITDTYVRKTSLYGTFLPSSAILLEGLSKRVEFLYVRVEEAPDHSEPL